MRTWISCYSISSSMPSQKLASLLIENVLQKSAFVMMLKRRDEVMVDTVATEKNGTWTNEKRGHNPSQSD